MKRLTPLRRGVMLAIGSLLVAATQPGQAFADQQRSKFEGVTFERGVTHDDGFATFNRTEDPILVDQATTRDPSFADWQGLQRQRHRHPGPLGLATATCPGVC